MTSSSEWLQFSEQTTTDHQYGHDDQIASNPLGFSSAPTNSSVHHHQQLMSSPPNKDGASKPIRRRSRASKKTPTTLLNANTSNFRALVQQFTGCPSPSTAPISLGTRKGPVNLNFGSLGTTSNYQNYQQITPHHQPHQRQQQQQQTTVPRHQQLLYEQDQQKSTAVSSLDHLISDNVIFNSASVSSNPQANLEINFDGFVMDDVPLHDLLSTRDSFPQ